MGCEVVGERSIWLSGGSERGVSEVAQLTSMIAERSRTVPSGADRRRAAGLSADSGASRDEFRLELDLWVRVARVVGLSCE